MAAPGNSVWAVDVGSNSVKALGLQRTADGVEVTGFDYIEHEKILTSPDVDQQERAELVAAALAKLVERHDFSKEEVVVSVPGQNSFARFIKLPPVEQKGIPKVIQYEAAQQIPFDMNDVQWDWQQMGSGESKEIEVGLFAIKNAFVDSALRPFEAEKITISCVQMAPMALYNYAVYDRKDLDESGREGLMLLDMGAENTDLVICTKTVVWQRSITIGGNAFTRAIADAFKLNFAKAEKLKRTAPMSKYARQILQAMKPVFADLATEIQRSLGFYGSTKRQTKLKKVIALGGGMKLQGLTKFLQQTLQMPVVRPDSFDRLGMSAGVSAAKFHENVADFGVVYGLALQGLGLANIETSLLPRHLARIMLWSRKAKYFSTAAAVFLVVCLLCFARAGLDRSKYGASAQARQEYNAVLREAQEAVNKLQSERSKRESLESSIEKQLSLFEYRDVVPQLNKTLIDCLPNARNNPEQAELYEAFANGQIGKVLSYPRQEREQLFVTGVSISYAQDLSQAEFESRSTRRRRSRRTPERPGGEMPPGMMPFPPGGPGGPGALPPWMGGGGPGPTGPRPRTQRPAGRRAAEQDGEEEKETAGFVVVLEGYSPYKNIMELLDPVAAGGDGRSDWGFMTRLRKLQEISADGQFELYSTEHSHFQLERGEVDLASDGMPIGIGRTKEIKTGSQSESTAARRGAGALPFYRADGRRSSTGSDEVVVDPLTDEIISKVIKRNEKGEPIYDTTNEPVYEINDHWFRVKAKFVWKDAPAKPEEPRSPGAMGMGRFGGGPAR